MDLKSISSDLKSINLESIKAKIKSIDKKILIKFGIGFLSVIIFLIIYYAVLSPIVEKKKAQLDNMQKKQAEITKMNQEIKASKAKIKKLTPRYEQYSTLFHTRAEVEGLYQTLSEFAGMNDLIISKIEKKKPEPVFKQGVAAQSEENIKQDMVSYYKIPVDYEIKGNFLSYIKFKRAVSRSKKMLNFDKELINVVQNDPNGAVIASGELTIVGLPNEFF